MYLKGYTVIAKSIKEPMENEFEDLCPVFKVQIIRFQAATHWYRCPRSDQLKVSTERCKVTDC